MQIFTKQPRSNILKSNTLPSLIYAGHISNEPNWMFPSHKHDNLSEVIYISEGEGTFVIDDTTYYAKKGDILVYNKGVIHDESSNPANPLKTYFCGIGNLHLDGVKEGDIIPSDINPVIHTGIYSEQVEQYISDIFHESCAQNFGYELVCQSLLVALIGIITRCIELHDDIELKESPKSLAYKIKNYLDTNYSNKISLKDMANDLYISQHYLSHVFKNEINISPISYLINRRIGEAKKLLINTNKKVHEISQEVGYDNPNYFTMIFKKSTGMSPKEFKNKYLLGEIKNN